jgi:high-affinity nickel-transport protein
VVTVAVALVWGMAQGMRHALEPDHLAAVSTLVASRRSARSAASYALAWGLGHALVLLAFGGVLLLVRGRVPDRLAAGFELVVAAMLVGLGVRGLRLALSRARPPHADGHAHAKHVTIGRTPLLVGCVHGLAGSGALAALVIPGMPSALAGLLYMALYGGGAALGMAMLAGVAGVPMARLVRTRGGVPILLGATGALSLVFGLAWGWAAAGVALS